MNSHVSRTFVPTLPACAYSSPDRHRLEFDKIFRRDWIYVLHKSQLPEPGCFETFDIGEVPLLIVRGADDLIRTFYNVCQQRGHILAEGRGQEREDNELIVSAHRGMRSGALESGIFVIDEANHAVTEAPLAHFNMLIERALARV